MTPREFGRLLWFWQVLKDETKKGESKKAWKEELRTRVAAMSQESLAPYTEILRRRYEEQQVTRASVATRAGSLFIFLGILTTGATIVAGSITTTSPIVFWLIVLVGILLLGSAFAAAFLAVRSQQVESWEAPSVRPEDGFDKRALDLTYAVEVMAAGEQNRLTLSNSVAYLRDAQAWARVALLWVVLLAPLAVAAAATKPTTPGLPVAAPSVGPSVAPSLAPTLLQTSTPAPAPPSTPSGAAPSHP